MNEITRLSRGEQRLLALADFLEAKIKREEFNMRHWVTKAGEGGVIAPGSGAVCDAAGWATAIEAFQKEGLTLFEVEPGKYEINLKGRIEGVLVNSDAYCGWTSIELFFDLDEDGSEYLFDHRFYRSGDRTRPDTVARRIRAYVNKKMFRRTEFGVLQ